MHGGQGHSGRSKGDHSASQSVAPSAQVQRSAPAVQPAAGGGILGSPRLSALFEALGPIGTQRLSDHIVGLPAVFRLGDPGWPERRRPEGGLRKRKGEAPQILKSTPASGVEASGSRPTLAPEAYFSSKQTRCTSKLGSPESRWGGWSLLASAHSTLEAGGVPQGPCCPGAVTVTTESMCPADLQGPGSPEAGLRLRPLTKTQQGPCPAPPLLQANSRTVKSWKRMDFYFAK